MDDPRDDYDCAACIFDNGHPIEFARWVNKCINANPDGSPCHDAPFAVMTLIVDGATTFTTMCERHFRRAMKHMNGTKRIDHRCGKTTTEIDDSTAPT